MRSTPLFLGGRLYHLRYDMNSVWDAEHLIGGGFNSIINTDISWDLCKYLLWSGLKWDNPDLTISDTETLIKSEGNSRTILEMLRGDYRKIIIGIMKVCIDELYRSGWYNTPSKETPSPPNGKENTISEIISAFERAAYYCQYPGDPWKLTPAEINFFVAAYNEHHTNDETEKNFRMGTICATVANCSGKSKGAGIPFEWRDFVPCGSQTDEDMINILFITAAALGADKT